jgi:superfamily II DNA or RNA helicase
VTAGADPRVAVLLAQLLEDGEPRDVRSLVRHVRARGGHGVSRAAVERTLAGDARFVDTGPRSGWTLAEAAEAAEATEGADVAAASERDGTGADGPSGDDGPAPVGHGGTRARLDALQLRAWQAEALAAWSATGRGVVEAVTGTGKTRLAVAAARILLDRGGRVLVLVPTLELQDQWARELRAVLPGVSIGRLGGGGDGDLFEHHVVLATPHSAAQVPIEPPPGAAGLLVADEAHRYGAPTWGAALKEPFSFRLALTATFERNDDGVADVLGPYFGDVVTRYGFDRAVADGTVAPFAIALASVALTDEERALHDGADRRVRQLRRELVGPLGMPKEPRALFAAVAAVVADADALSRDGPQVAACREYLVRVRERRDVAATAAGKLDVCRVVAPALRGGRSLVFSDTVDQAEDAALLLRGAGVAAETVHGQLSTDRRRIRLAQFRRGRIHALVAPRVLDEGIDVPDADVAVVLAAFRTRRQMVQRLGRVLRLKPDGRAARLVLAVAEATAEDPDHGGHEGFLREVREVASEVVRFDVTAQRGELGAWLDAASEG